MSMNIFLPVDSKHYVEIRKWCFENFGGDNNGFTWALMANNEIGGHLYVEHEEDAMAFKLRWL